MNTQTPVLVRLRSEPDATGQPVPYHSSPTACLHAESMCDDCFDLWELDYLVDYTSPASRALMAKSRRS